MQTSGCLLKTLKQWSTLWRMVSSRNVKCVWFVKCKWLKHNDASWGSCSDSMFVVPAEYAVSWRVSGAQHYSVVYEELWRDGDGKAIKCCPAVYYAFDIIVYNTLMFLFFYLFASLNSKSLILGMQLTTVCVVTLQLQTSVCKNWRLDIDLAAEYLLCLICRAGLKLTSTFVMIAAGSYCTECNSIITTHAVRQHQYNVFSNQYCIYKVYSLGPCSSYMQLFFI